MKQIEITKKYAYVLKHRLNNADIPSYDHLEKLAQSGFATKKELKKYIKKAKDAYSSVLLHVNNNKSNGHTESLQKEVS